MDRTEWKNTPKGHILTHHTNAIEINESRGITWRPYIDRMSGPVAPGILDEINEEPQVVCKTYDLTNNHVAAILRYNNDKE